MVSVISSLRGTMIISKEDFQPSIFSTALYIFLMFKICSHLLLLTHFLALHFRTSITVKQTSYQRSYIFIAASVILKWEQPVEAASFSRKDFFFRTPSCLEELLLSNNYVLVTNTFSDQLLLEDKYFFSTATAMFWRSIQKMYFSEAGSSSA